MATTVEFNFSKAFFAEYLCVSENRISFVIIRYEDEEDRFDYPAIKVKGVDKYFFNLEIAKFFFCGQSPNFTPIPTKIKICKDRVIFKAKDSEEEYKLSYFRSSFENRVVSSLIEDKPSALAVPTIRKNKWESGDPILKIRFNKRFWSKLLHVDQRYISYGLIRANIDYADDDPYFWQYTDWVPVLKVKGVSNYYFWIERARFCTLEELSIECRLGISPPEYVPTKIVLSRNEVIFRAKSGEMGKLQLADVYRFYMTQIANDWIF